MIQTTTVGSYPTDATRVVFDTQRQAGIDLPTDGELYRFDVNHPDTNGMIEYFVHKLSGIDSRVGRADTAAFRAKHEMAFRSKPAAVVRARSPRACSICPKTAPAPRRWQAERSSR